MFPSEWYQTFYDVVNVIHVDGISHVPVATALWVAGILLWLYTIFFVGHPSKPRGYIAAIILYALSALVWATENLTFIERG